MICFMRLRARVDGLRRRRDWWSGFSLLDMCAVGSGEMEWAVGCLCLWSLLMLRDYGDLGCCRTADVALFETVSTEKFEAILFVSVAAGLCFKRCILVNHH